jgi:secondary thiamine-phosphate synthase enzyme
MSKIHQLDVKTRTRVEFVKVDGLIQDVIRNQGIRESVCHIYVPHTTAGITINEGADPDVARDIIAELDRVIPLDDNYLHVEGNSAAHIKASLVGPSVNVFVENGRLVLGRWQSIFFCEFDGPRHRKVWVRFTA